MTTKLGSHIPPRCTRRSGACWRALASILVLAGLLSACGSQQPPDAAPAAHPNVALILIDTLRADRVRAVRNGQLVMPFLAQLSSQGIYYPNAISPSSWTKPAMASLFTGVYPNAHGVIHSARTEDPDHPTSDILAASWDTLAEHFAAAGYTTWGFQTNANLTRPLGFAQGFAGGCYTFHNGAPARQVTDAALMALPDLAAPFFLYAHYMDPHAPYRPAPEIEGALGPMPALPDADRALLDDDERFMAYYLDQVKTAIGLQPAPTLPDLTEAGKEAVRHRYDLECHATDRAVERLVTRIQTQHPETIIIILSDHGEEFWERGGMGHGTTLHAEQVRVPLMIVEPDQRGEIRDESVSTLIILEYLAGRLGLPLKTAPGPVLSYTRGPWPQLGIDQRSIVQGDYLLIDDRARQRTTLYNLRLDPVEQEDLAEVQSAEADHLRGLLGHYLDAAPVAPADTAPLSESDIEALEAVGYLDSGP